MRSAASIAAAVLLVLSACNRNTATGNDTEAQLDHAPMPAPIMPASEALSGIATEAVAVETMNDNEVASLGLAQQCSIRLTAVGFPSFVYGSPESVGYIKLNSKLIPLPWRGDGIFADDDLRVLIRPADEEFGSDGMREAEMILMLPGARQEKGYRGYEFCPHAVEQ